MQRNNTYKVFIIWQEDLLEVLFGIAEGIAQMK